MPLMTPQSDAQEDHGHVVPRRRIRISWVWLFPLLAASAASYMFFNNWLSQGPEIQIEFASAPGIRAEKTPLYYRGVVAGIVSSVELGPNLEKAIVKVRLKEYAKELAREGSVFWIDQPVFNLAQASGIQSLIDGNSLQATMGSGHNSTYFVGSNQIPVATQDGASFTVRLKGAEIPSITAGCEVTFRGVAVGVVTSKGLDENQNPYVDITLDKDHADLVSSGARFWIVPPWSVNLGPGQITLNVPSLKSFVLGSIAFDYFGDKGSVIPKGTVLGLCESEKEARAVSEPITLEFHNGQGLLAGETQLRYQGVPVGIVTKVTPIEGSVIVTARLQQGYEMLRRKGSSFAIVRATIDIPKVSGLETLVSGVYIACNPGPKGAVTDSFQGMSQEEAESIDSLENGFEIILQSISTQITQGSTVMYRGVRVGKIVGKKLSPDRKKVLLTASILKRYSSLLHENTRFWNASGVKISGGLIDLNINSSAIESRALGVIEFATPDAVSQVVKPGHLYDLYDSPKKDWLKWILKSPPLPLPSNQ